MSQETGEIGSYKGYELSNYYCEEKSIICFGKTVHPNCTRYDVNRGPLKNYLDIPLIKFSNKEDVIARIEKLIVFS